MLDISAGDKLKVELNTRAMSGEGNDNMILGGIEPPPPAKKIMGNIKFLASDYNDNSGSINKGKFMNFGSFYFRPNMSIICKRLGVLKDGYLEIEFNRSASLDYLVLAKNLKTARVENLEMLIARHNQFGDVMDQLRNEDQDYTEIFPGDEIAFTFNKGQGSQNKKEYILKSVGRYETDTAYVMKKGNNLTTQEDESIIPKENKLFDNYPNPFNPSTQIKYSIKEQGLVKLKIYDALGKAVTELVNQIQPAGTYTVNFNASRFASGIYFYSITTKDFYEVKKMILLK